MAVIRQYCENCFVQIVGLLCQTERTSASSTEKVCYYSLKLCFFSWQVVKTQAAIHKVVECLANNEFFCSYASQGVESPETSSDSEIELEASFCEDEVLKYYFNPGFNYQEILTFFLNTTTTRKVKLCCYDDLKSTA